MFGAIRVTECDINQYMMIAKCRLNLKGHSILKKEKIEYQSFSTRYKYEASIRTYMYIINKTRTWKTIK